MPVFTEKPAIENNTANKKSPDEQFAREDFAGLIKRKARLEKLKKGLMQDLLTGRKRVTPETMEQKKVG